MHGTDVSRQAVLKPLADGFCSGEAPRWFEGLLWFSDPVGEAVHTVDLRGSMTTLPLPGHSPSGLGFRPDGSLLIASATDRRILRYDGETVSTHVDLSQTVPADLGDMVVDGLGHAYVGCPGEGVIMRINPGGTATIVAAGLQHPSGMGITADGKTLIVAESVGRRLTGFRIDVDGTLSDGRIFADGLAGPPNGIALDAYGGVWTSMTLAHQFQHVVAGGAVTDRLDIGNRIAVSCALGGPGRRILFLLSSADTHSCDPKGSKLSRLDAITLDLPSAGLP